jgi:amino acid transporter
MTEPAARRLSSVELYGQSIANVGPSLTPTLNITVVAALAGPGSWAAYLVATIGMMCVAASIGALARRHPQSGSFFLYIGRNFGPFAGALTGWAMVAAYLFTAVAISLGVSLFIGDVLRLLGASALVPPAWVLVMGIVGLAATAGYRDVQLSARLALGLEAASLAIIIAIITAVVARHGTLVDRSQLDLAALPAGGISAGLAFAVFSFVGFESAATLARESRDAANTLPRVIMVSAAGVGLFFTAIAYLMVLATKGGAAAIGASGAPFAMLTIEAGFGWLAAIVYLAAVIGGFGCIVASLNAGSRLLFSMARYGFLPPPLGRLHARRGTPHVAVLAGAALVLAAALAVLPLGTLLAFGLTGTFATLGFLLVYLGVCLVAPIDLRRSGGLTPGQGLMALAGVCVISFVIIGTVWPVPTAPYDRLPWLFALYMALGAALFAWAGRRHPGALAAIEADLEQ